MTWTRLDDNFADDEELWECSDAAFRLHVSAILFCNRKLTDGRIKASKVASLVPFAPRKAAQAAGELVSADKWEITEDGYSICNFLRWNKPKARIEAERRAKREAGAMGGAAAAASRSGEAQGVVRLGSGSGGSKSKTTKRGAPEGFAEFWALYPRRDDRRKAETAFRAALTRAPLAEILDGAERYRGDPNRTAEYTKLAATWLNADAWENGLLPSRNVDHLDAWLAAKEADRG